MSTTSEKALATFVAIVAFGIMMMILIESELIGHVWHYWQVNVVDTAYKGPSDFHATEWWALPALLISFAIPVIGLMIPVVVALSVFGIALKAVTSRS